MRRIIVSAAKDILKVALLQNGETIEYIVERPDVKQTVGNIYKGRVINVLPGMQAAFVDIGQSKNAFLYVDDLLHAHIDKQPKEKPQITELIQPGDELVVQVSKEALKTKGAKITTHLSIPGRWLVYMPYADYVAVSRKVDSAERQRLQSFGEAVREPGEGMILRTIAASESLDVLQKDLDMMRAAWKVIEEQAKLANAPAELYKEWNVLQRSVRDLFTDQVDELLVDCPVKYAEIEELLAVIHPNLTSRVKLYRDDVPILQRFRIEESVSKLFRNKVWLSNGGYIQIDQTEALTVVDVNTGKYTGSHDLEETVYETNRAAAEMICHLLRLRDIGGIIIVDFIDMMKEEHRQAIASQMERKLAEDRTKTLVVGWTRLGLLELTRKKVRESVEDAIIEPCSACGGTGRKGLKLRF